MKHTTVIIGGGMAGISCANRLKEFDKDFVLITETIGGRVKYLKDHHVNMGAYFIINNYHNAKKLLRKEKWLNTADALFVDNENNSFKTLSLMTLSLVPHILKFTVSLLRFGHHYKKFKQQCTRMTHIEALKNNPYLSSLSEKSSSDFITEKKLGTLYDAVISKFAYACTLTPPENLSAFDLLTVCQGILVPMYKFSFDEQKIADSFSDKLIRDRVTLIEKKEQYFEITTEGGKAFTAENLVLATPADVTGELMGLRKIRGHSSAYVFHLRGTPNPRYDRHGMNLFSPGYEISAITKEYNNTYLVFSRNRDTDLSKYFTKWEILEQVNWDTALFVHGNSLLEQNFGENCCIAGDHNACGLEPACIAGIYAANRILESAYNITIKVKSRFWKKALISTIFAGVIFVLSYLPLISPFLLTRGATPQEVSMRLPGDELVPSNPKINMTHAVTVNTAPDKVWPWMVQIGQDRAGFYSFEKLERLFGFGIRNTYRIVPEWQRLAPGDFVKFHRNGIGMKVVRVNEGKHFVLLTDSRNPMTPVPGRREEFRIPLPGGMYTVWNWSFNLVELPGGKTRIIIRCLADWPETNIVLNWMLHFGSEITGCVMNWQLINELRQCAEGEQNAIRIHL